jgi:hypothetical protein
MTRELEALDAGLKEVYKALEPNRRDTEQEKQAERDEQEQRQETINEGISNFILAFCDAFRWDASLEHHREAVKGMIRKAVEK